MPRLHMLITKAELERADTLTEWASLQADIAPTGTATRSHVIREAIRRGLASLERQRARDEKAGQ